MRHWARKFTGKYKSNEKGSDFAVKARVWLLLFLLILVVAMTALISGKVMRIREVAVLGCEERSPAEVVNLAAIENEQSVFTLKFKQITAQIDVSPYFDVTDISYVFPNTLRIVVSERKASAAIEHLGGVLVTDETGYVLEAKPNFADTRRIPQVTGLRIVEGYQVCETLESSQASQIDAMRAILTQLRAQNVIQLIEEVNLEAVSDIRMTTVSGFEVRLGNFEAMDKKIQWLRAVEPILASEGYTAGIITVSTGDHATFMEAGGQTLQLPLEQIQQALDDVPDDVPDEE